MCKTSLNLSEKADLAEFQILQLDWEYWILQEDDFWMCVKMGEI